MSKNHRVQNAQYYAYYELIQMQHSSNYNPNSTVLYLYSGISELPTDIHPIL